MGILLYGLNWVLGDNISEVRSTSCTTSQATLNKPHRTLCFHCVFKTFLWHLMIYICYMYIVVQNSSDSLTKALGWVIFWPLIQSIFCCKAENISPTPLPMAIKDLILNRGYKMIVLPDDNCIVPNLIKYPVMDAV
jgi:hypothetical protein